MESLRREAITDENRAQALLRLSSISFVDEVEMNLDTLVKEVLANISKEKDNA